MPESIHLPAMDAPQRQAWLALLDIYDMVPRGWTLVGGQMVHLHCAERGQFPPRPTNDVDAVLDIRADPTILERVTEAMLSMEFRPEMSGEGLQHRWRRDLAQIDILIPEGVGERAAARPGAAGAPTIPSPGTTQALNRTEPVNIILGARAGTVLRPNLIGALVAKAAAGTEIAGDSVRERHCTDFVVLANLLAAKDLRETPLQKKDKRRLQAMVDRCRVTNSAMLVPGATTTLTRLERGAGLPL